MLSARNSFYDDGFVTDVTTRNVEVQIRQTANQILVVRDNGVVAYVVYPPGGIMEIRSVPVHFDDNTHVMQIFSSDVLVDGRKATRPCAFAGRHRR